MAATALAPAGYRCRAGTCLSSLRTSVAGTRTLRIVSPTRRQTRQVTCALAEAPAERKTWLPGSTLPSYLDGSLPGDVGFDPLNLAADPEDLKWYVHAELLHCRYAMAGVAGMLATDILRVTGLNPDIPVWFEAGVAKYGIDTPTLLAIQLFLYAFVESKRWADYKNPGSQGNYEEAFFFWMEPALGGVANGYPGGPLFDPLGMAEDFDSDRVHKLKEQEIANGRLAMLAAVGFWVQAKATGKGPFENLLTHLADPWHTTIIDNFVP